MTESVVLLLEADAIARHALAEYLRQCGYKVVEAASTDEVDQYLNSGAEADLAMLDLQAPGQRNAFELAQWFRSNRPLTEIILVGSVASAAEKAGDLCENGPSLSRPYDHSKVTHLIKQLRSKRGL